MPKSRRHTKGLIRRDVLSCCFRVAATLLNPPNAFALTRKPRQEAVPIAKEPGAACRVQRIVGRPFKRGHLRERTIRSEERRVGKECRFRWSRYEKKKKKEQG